MTYFCHCRVLPSGTTIALVRCLQKPLVGLVLSVMIWSLIAPAAMGAAGTVTSACCRRNGKHHCASGISGMAGMSGDGGPSFRASAPDCPYRSQIGVPNGAAQPYRYLVSTPGPPHATLAALEKDLHLASRFSTSNSQRGPPRILALAKSE
jgi:hypothetical protein